MLQSSVNLVSQGQLPSLMILGLELGMPQVQTRTTLGSNEPSKAMCVTSGHPHDLGPCCTPPTHHGERGKSRNRNHTLGLSFK